MESENEIRRYVKMALENENFLDYEITMTPGNTKSDGYSGNIMFATASGTSAEGAKKVELAIKSSKKNFFARFKNMFKREIYFYEVILPAFIRFQRDNNIKDIFNSVPKCYKAISDTSVAVLVMENLRKTGYDLYDRKKPLDINHLKLVLKEYGKLHAISFALREKRKNDFEKIVAADFDDLTFELLDDAFRNAMQLGMKRVCGILENSDAIDIYEQCLKICQKGVDKVFVEVLESKEPESAILHGDCWTSNLIYKYEDEDHRFPSNVAILDWQLTRLHSPVLDLSYLIYSTSSEEQLEHFDELLETYYNSFSNFLKELGCDPEKLFPYSALQRHWKKYAMFGVLLVTSFLHVIICDTEDSPQYDEEGDGHDVSDKMMNVPIKNETELHKRLVAVVSHYFKYNV